ncbi:MAG: 16S rRNA (adenine(1518)-N(6)/adenine(1519)-N(6))-dimethyltransferase RsmA [Chitinophagaceae bacterium]
MIIKKSLGQHFLKDTQIVYQIISYLSEQTFTYLIEIGPGTGILTKHLLKIPHINFKAIEIDKDKLRILQPLFINTNTRLIEADILKMEIPFKEPFFIIGNFPYNISTQIVFKIIEWQDNVKGMIGMFQKEVAKRITAKEGSKIYGITSILTQVFFDAQYLFDVNPESFLPPPKVMSGIILLKHKSKPLDFKNQSLLFALVKISFSQRRKTLRNSAGYLFNKDIIQQPIFSKRPEQLSPQQFCELTFLMNTI